MTDATDPTADVVDVSPDPRDGGVDSVSIRFSEAVTGLDLADLHLGRDGGANLLTAAQTLGSSDGGVTWVLGNLSGLTGAPGTYTLTLTAAGKAARTATTYRDSRRDTDASSMQGRRSSCT